jgi:hypothetical protein
VSGSEPDISRAASFRRPTGGGEIEAARLRLGKSSFGGQLNAPAL